MRSGPKNLYSLPGLLLLLLTVLPSISSLQEKATLVPRKQPLPLLRTTSAAASTSRVPPWSTTESPSRSNLTTPTRRSEWLMLLLKLSSRNLSYSWGAALTDAPKLPMSLWQTSLSLIRFSNNLLFPIYLVRGVGLTGLLAFISLGKYPVLILLSSSSLLVYLPSLHLASTSSLLIYTPCTLSAKITTASKLETIFPPLRLFIISLYY